MTSETQIAPADPMAHTAQPMRPTIVEAGPSVAGPDARPLRFALWPDGTVEHACAGGDWLNLFPGSPVEGGPWNLWLRRLADDGSGRAEAWAPLLGPASPLRTVALGGPDTTGAPDAAAAVAAAARSAVAAAIGPAMAPPGAPGSSASRPGSGVVALRREGVALGLSVSLSLVLDAEQSLWCWQSTFAPGDDARASEPSPALYDVIAAQDVGLTSEGAARTNEYYVSQYIDFTPLDDGPFGIALAVRQNQPVGGRFPWLLAGATRRVVAWATDAWQWHGAATRDGQPAPALVHGLPAARLQHEQALLALQVEPFAVDAAAPVRFGVWGLARADHRDASGSADLALARVARASAACRVSEAGPSARWGRGSRRGEAGPAASLFGSAPLLPTQDLDEPTLRALYPGDAWRHVERDAAGRLLSLYTDAATHVVLKSKAVQARRPHGHILRSGSSLIPDERALTSTVWMAGTFHSMLTEGHVSINRLLSTVRGFDGQFRSQGLRLFVRPDGGTWSVLGLPSAFEMQPADCRWLYAVGGGLLAVRAWASDPAPWTTPDPVGPQATRADPSDAAQAQAQARTEGRRHRMLLDVRWLRAPTDAAWSALRCRASLHLALDGDDGRLGLPVRASFDGRRLSLRPPIGSGLDQRFPRGRFDVVAPVGTRWTAVADDAGVMDDGVARGLPFVTIDGVVGGFDDGEDAATFGLAIEGHLIDGAIDDAVGEATVAPGVAALPTLLPRDATEPAGAQPLPTAWSCLADALPWLHHNALVHYLSPRGLEQFSGGGWGTRDVSQGPLELLLALDQDAPARDLLLRTFAAQNADGDWPQWFMFFERERAIRPADSHGDIVFWPVLALARYLRASGDASILDAPVPFFDAPAEPLRAHVERALAVMRDRRIAGTALTAYGHGDWNDSLQPADPTLREHLCSAWTVTLCHETLSTLADALEELALLPQWVGALRGWAAGVQRDFERHLIVDGVMPGYVLFEPGREPQPLLHPRDRTTGLRLSSLAMFHAILAGMLTPAQARAHLELIARDCSGVDGLRLFDRPLPYRGGPMRLFQRAESATFFGREIGLMYMHAHVRHAQALAHVGDAAAFVAAVERMHPIGITQRVRGATLRQSNCYYSSSDAAFADRQVASRDYAKVRDGSVDLDGGWRIYSSGPGIAIGTIVGHLLGLRRRARGWEIDPVMTADFDGARIAVDLDGGPAVLTLRVGARGHGVESIAAQGRELSFERIGNPYRIGAAFVDRETLRAACGAGPLELVVQVG